MLLHTAIASISISKSPFVAREVPPRNTQWLPVANGVGNFGGLHAVVTSP
jgi:hypothetical protein